MKIKILKNKRDMKAGDVADVSGRIAAKFIQQGFAEEITKKPQPTKKAKTTKLVKKKAKRKSTK